MLGPLLCLDRGLPAKAQASQKLADHRAVGAMPALKQPVGEVAHAAADPQKRRLGIPAGYILDQHLEILDQRGILLDLRGPSPTRPP
jgi:hypothetical protein